jgi:hypothetical protein
MITTNFSVSPEVKATLPDVLIDWLSKLAISEEDRNNPVQTFVLTLEKLGDYSIQNIRYADKLRRLVGFPPVTFNLQVRRCNNQYQMMAN